jgi:hypothetical protein
VILVTLRQTFLVLLPHRDIRLVLRKNSDSLFKAGFSGAYLFPWAAPLALLSRPLTAEELKHCARAVREASLSTGDGRINAAETCTAAFLVNADTENCPALLGLRLDLALPSDVFGSDAKITSVFSPPILGVCLLPSAQYDTAALPPVPKVSFRAAAVANMIWQPMEAVVSQQGAAVTDSGSFGCKWKIRKPCWLAPIRKKS